MSTSTLYIDNIYNKAGTGGLTIDSSGNVGIGTSIPSDKLEIHSLASSDTNYGLKLKGSTVDTLGETVGIKFEWNTAVAAGVRAVLENVANGAAGLSLETSEDGSSLTEKFRIDKDGHITPGVDNTQDFGSSSKRWRNIYTGDLHLSNEGSVNDVDGTSGDWTIQEGSEDLFLINNKSGKKYKFKMEEV